MNEKQLRKHYQEVFDQAIGKMIDRQVDGYDGNSTDFLKSMNEADIQDLASVSKMKAIRIKNTNNPDTQEDNALDVINYMVAIVGRLYG